MQRSSDPNFEADVVWWKLSPVERDSLFRLRRPSRPYLLALGLTLRKLAELVEDPLIASGVEAIGTVLADHPKLVSEAWLRAVADRMGRFRQRTTPAAHDADSPPPFRGWSAEAPPPAPSPPSRQRPARVPRPFPLPTRADLGIQDVRWLWYGGPTGSNDYRVHKALSSMTRPHGAPLSICHPQRSPAPQSADAVAFKDRTLSAEEVGGLRLLKLREEISRGKRPPDAEGLARLGELVWHDAGVLSHLNEGWHPLDELLAHLKAHLGVARNKAAMTDAPHAKEYRRSVALLEAAWRDGLPVPDELRPPLEDAGWPGLAFFDARRDGLPLPPALPIPADDGADAEPPPPDAFASAAPASVPLPAVPPADPDEGVSALVLAARARRLADPAAPKGLRRIAPSRKCPAAILDEALSASPPLSWRAIDALIQGDGASPLVAPHERDALDALLARARAASAPSPSPAPPPAN